MRHRKKTLKLGRTASHRRALFANLVASLIQKEQMVTTLAKARAAQPLADKMVTLAKKDTLAARRRAVRYLRDQGAVRKLFSEVGPRFAERNGGYTRILKLAAARRGDGAALAQLSFVVKSESGKAPAGAKKEKERPGPPPSKTDEQG